MIEIPKFANNREWREWLNSLYPPEKMKEDDTKILRYELIGIENKEKHDNPEWRAEWLKQNKLAAQKRAQTPEWIVNQKLAGQKRLQNSEWKENVIVAIKQRCNKSISCNGIIYESGTQAALALAPETRLTHDSRGKWLRNQMKKFPDRYFYITKSE